VPAGESNAPGAVPFHLALFGRRAELPQGEIGGEALFADLDPRPGLQSFDIQASHDAVIGEAGGVEVNAIAGAIGEPLLFDAFDQLDLLGDMLCGAAPYRWGEDIQGCQVVLESLGIEFGDLPGGFSGA